MTIQPPAAAAPAGRRDQRVTVQEATRTANSAGQLEDTWSTYCTRWVGVEAIAGDETTHAKRRRAEVTHVLEFPFDALTRAMTAKMRVLWGSRVLHLTRVYDPDGGRRLVEAEATEVVP